MRFSKGLYPHLTKERWGQIRFDSGIADDIRQSTISAFHEIHSLTGIDYVSKVFKKEAWSNFDRLLEHSNVVYGEPYSVTDNSRFHIFGYTGVECYILVGGLFCTTIWTDDNVNYNPKKGFYTRAYSSKRYLDSLTKNLGDTIKINEYLSQEFMKSFVYYSFAKIAELKAKQLPPKGKLKDFHCRYKSDLNIPINLLTENWYTESCQNHPFVVRGHWRMQACGEGLSERKLIYVNPFMKKGYTKGTYKDN